MKELEKCIEDNKLVYDDILEEYVDEEDEKKQTNLKIELEKLKYYIKGLEYAKIILEKELR